MKLHPKGKRFMIIMLIGAATIFTLIFLNILNESYFKSPEMRIIIIPPLVVLAFVFVFLYFAKDRFVSADEWVSKNPKLYLFTLFFD